MEPLDFVFLKGYVFLLVKAIAFTGIHWLIKETQSFEVLWRLENAVT